MTKNILILLILSLVLAGCGGGGGGGGTSSPAKADLQVIGNGTLDEGSTLIVGQSYDLMITVKNAGGTTAPAGWLLKLETSNDDSTTQSVNVALGAGDSESSDGEITFTPEASDIGALTITLTLDSSDVVSESNEANNVQSEVYAVIAAPPIIAN